MVLNISAASLTVSPPNIAFCLMVFRPKSSGEKSASSLSDSLNPLLLIFLPSSRARSLFLIRLRIEEAGEDDLMQWVSSGEAVSLDQIAARSGMKIADVTGRVLELELAGDLERRPDGRYSRIRVSAPGSSERETEGS